MSLPIRTVLADIDAVCSYLATKPTGARLTEAKAVVDRRHLDGRKLSALKFWCLIEDDGTKIKLTELGRQAVRQSGSYRSEVLRRVIREVRPYVAVIERVAHRHEETISATEVAAHWHEHFRGDVSESEKTLNDQAVCFFQIAEGADLGTLIIGRRGQPTRFDFDTDAVSRFVSNSSYDTPQDEPVDSPAEVSNSGEVPKVDQQWDEPNETATHNGRVFIAHGSNTAILHQLKELVSFGKFEPVVATERETAAEPVPKKVMDDMRTCEAAVIHVSVERVLYDVEQNEFPQINGNVLIEIGAAMALYGEKFILLVQEGVKLPSNLQGLYECRYEGDELNMAATMKLLKAFNRF